MQSSLLFKIFLMLLVVLVLLSTCHALRKSGIRVPGRTRTKTGVKPRSRPKQKLTLSDQMGAPVKKPIGASSLSKESKMITLPSLELQPPASLSPAREIPVREEPILDYPPRDNPSRGYPSRTKEILLEGILDRLPGPGGPTTYFPGSFATKTFPYASTADAYEPSAPYLQQATFSPLIPTTFKSKEVKQCTAKFTDSFIDELTNASTAPRSYYYDYEDSPDQYYDNHYYADNDDLYGRLWAGELLNPIKVPFAATLIRLGVVACSGSFITPKVIITAAHCISEPIEYDDYSVRYDTATPAIRDSAREIDAAEVIVHEDYRCGVVESAVCDIALVILVENAYNMGRDQVLELPYPDEGKAFIDKDKKVNFVASGTSFRSEKQHQLKGIQTRLTTKNCDYFGKIKYFDTERQVCNYLDDKLVTCPSIVSTYSFNC